jgi:hypothetical protein
MLFRSQKTYQDSPASKVGYFRVVTFQGARINGGRRSRELAIVKTDALSDNVKAEGLITALKNQLFGNTRVVLMTQDCEFGPVFYGRADLVRFLETLDVSQIPWAEYTVQEYSA